MSALLGLPADCSPATCNLLASHNASNLTSTSCHAGSRRSVKVIRMMTRTCAHTLLLLKELSFLTSPQWVSAQSMSSTRIGVFTCPHLV